MGEAEGARSFRAGAEAYDRFMGRYSRELAPAFADVAGITSGVRVLDVGAGPGALTAVAVERVGADLVCALDPAEGFVSAFRLRHPGVDIRQARAEDIPFDDEAFDCAAAQLVHHFVTDPTLATAEMARTVRPGGTVAACVWDPSGMEMLRLFWQAARMIDDDFPPAGQDVPLGAAGALAELFGTVPGLGDITETTLTVSSTYRDHEDLWSGFLAGIGPAGGYFASLDPPRQEALGEALFERLGRPAGSFELHGVARAVRATKAP